MNSNETRNIAIVGIDGSGKTSLCQALKGKDCTIPPDPTLGIGFKELHLANSQFNLFDLGGHEDFREDYWPKWVGLAHGIIYVVDSTERNYFRNQDTKHWYWHVLEMNDKAPVFVVASKYDLYCQSLKRSRKKSKTVTPRKKIMKLLEGGRIPILNEALKRRNFEFCEISSKTGHNLELLKRWLLDNITVLPRKIASTFLMPQKLPKNQLVTSELRGLFVFSDNSGVPLAELMFNQTEDQPDTSLVLGMLAAFRDFTEKGAKIGELQAFQTNQHEVLFVDSYELTCAAFFDKGANIAFSRTLLEEFLLKFRLKYYQRIQEFQQSGQVVSSQTELINFLLEHSPSLIDPQAMIACVIEK